MKVLCSELPDAFSVGGVRFRVVWAMEITNVRAPNDVKVATTRIWTQDDIKF